MVLLAEEDYHLEKEIFKLRFQFKKNNQIKEMVLDGEEPIRGLEAKEEA